MFQQNKLTDSQSSTILRLLREQEKMADKKLTYPLENIEPSSRSNALPPLEAKAPSGSCYAQSGSCYAQSGSSYTQSGSFYTQSGSNYTQSGSNYTPSGSSYTSNKVMPSGRPVSRNQPMGRRGYRVCSDDSVRYETFREASFSEQNGNVRQIKDFDSYLDDAVKRHEEEKLFSKTRTASDDCTTRKRSQRPKSAYHGRRRPQTSHGSYSERTDFSLDE